MSLVAWYPLNENTLDYSGNGYHLNNNGATLVSDGKTGPCYQCNGTSNYMNSEDVSTYLHGREKASVAMWCKKGSIQYGFFQLSGYPDLNGNLYSYQTETKVYLDTFRVNRLGPIEMPTTVLEWHHFAVTQEPGNNGWKLYQNGVLVYQTTGSSSINTNYGEFEIGRNSGTRYADAKFNDVRIYDHVLSAKEIKELSKAKILHFKMSSSNELAKGMIRDCSSLKNNGQVINEAGLSLVNDSKIELNALHFTSGSKVQMTPIKSKILTGSVWLKWTDHSTSWRTVFASNGNVHPFIFNNARKACIFDGTTRSFNYTIPDDEWHHYVVIWRGTSADLYVDGEFNSSVITTFDPSTQPITLIGNWDSGSYSVGTLNDVRIYATSLSDKDIKELYQTRAMLDNNGNLYINKLKETGLERR